MHTRLTIFLQVNKLFFSLQFGFRYGYSTNHALTSLTEMIRRAIDEDKFACGVLLIFRRPLTLLTMASFSQNVTTIV